MSVQPSHRKTVSILLMSVLTLQLGCRGWIEKPIVPDTGIGVPQRGLLRITKTDGGTITLNAFVVMNDSIVGVLAAGHEVRAAVARTDISKIEVRGDTTPRGARIAGKVYLGGMMVLGVFYCVVGVAFFIATNRTSR